MKKVLSVALVLFLFVAPVLAGDGETAPSFFRSEAFAELVISVVVLGLYLARLKVNAKIRRVIDMCIGIANGVEKGIPDGTDIAGLQKIDKGLRRFNRDWAKLSKKKPAEWLRVIARGAFERWVADRNAGRHL